MKVHELISILQNCDPDAEVVLAEQPTYPMEHKLVGVSVREDFTDAPFVDEDDEDDEVGPFSRERKPGEARPNDVLLLEGAHLRYGNKAAWTDPTYG